MAEIPALRLPIKHCLWGTRGAYSSAVVGDISECYRILELGPGATLEDAKHSYRELVKVWHPDRFAHDPALQRKAQEKLKLINLAYERICKSEAAEPRRGAASARTKSPRAHEPAKPTGSDGSSGSRSDSQRSAPRHPPTPPPSRPPATNWTRRSVQFVIAAVIIAVVKTILSTSESPKRRSADYSPPKSQPSPTHQVGQPPVIKPSRNTDSAAATTIKSPEKSDASVASFPMMPNPAVVYQGSGVVKGKDVEGPVGKTLIPDLPAPITTGRGFFTVGSTKDEVLAVQGTPKQVTDTEFGYGYSTVYFANGRVKSWNDISGILKTKLLPATQVDGKGFFTIGSTKDEVLAVQGTPKQVADTKFGYGYSTVYFENDRVKSWNDISKILKTKLVPTSAVEAKDFFTIGSTKDEVLAVQGTPKQVTDTAFHYGYSIIYFENGRVKSWNDISHNLKVKLLAKTPK